MCTQEEHNRTLMFKEWEEDESLMETKKEDEGFKRTR